MRLRVLVSGMLAGHPGQGGATWAVLQYVLGLRRLGHEVVVVEPVDAADLAPGSPVVRQLAAVCDRFALDAVALLGRGTRDAIGLGYDELVRQARAADVLLNVSGMLADPALRDGVPVRAYLDLDPCFNQVWATQGQGGEPEAHTHRLTVGTLVGQPECAVPTLDLDWIPTLPPVVLEHWPVAADPPALPLTTVGNWRSYGPVEHDGRRYGLRAHAMRELADLPQRTRAELAAALAIHPGDAADIEALRRGGWRLLDPAVARTPDGYRDFVRRSAAEIGIAKHGYVAARTGWFSDRSACYLASGRPVLAQDTGFGAALPTGEGLLAFGTVDEAAAGAEVLLADPARHGRAAREMAEALLDSDRVLGRLLDVLGAVR